MRIKLLRNLASSYGCSLKEGEVGDVPAALAEALIAQKLAIAVAEPVAIKGVPEQQSGPIARPAQASEQQQKRR